MRNSILAQVLDQSARARLSNLALVKPEKTKAVENYLIQMARYGQLSGKVCYPVLPKHGFKRSISYSSDDRILAESFHKEIFKGENHHTHRKS